MHEGEQLLEESRQEPKSPRGAGEKASMETEPMGNIYPEGGD